MIRTIFLPERLKIVFGKKLKVYIQFLFIVLLANTILTTNVFAQSKSISGTVTDDNNDEPLIGVSISIKGTATGAVSDLNGNYQLQANTGDVLVFSFVGYVSKELTLENETKLNIALAMDLLELDELVVIGYGVQKKKLNTGATINVKGEDIQKQNTATAMDALKGMSPGVSITQNNGVPGSGTKVTIRGAGTIHNPNPLYVVDGVTVGNIDYLAPSDIESIDVLKDAASAAIYGSQAANGVILVTTKKGRKGHKPIITYDFYHGWSEIYKKPELLNAQQYVEILDEAYANSGRPEIDWAQDIPRWDEIEAGTYSGTDWFNEFENEDAQVRSHAFNISGGSEKSTYALGFSTLKEEGVLGNDMNNTYDRQSLRINSEHIIVEHKGQPLIIIGENLTYTHSKTPSIRTGNIYWNDLHNMIVTSPMLPMDAEDETDPAYPYHYATDWNPNEINPIADARNNSKYNYNNNNSIIGNAYLEIQPIKNLAIRSSYGVNAWFGESRQWVPDYDLGPKNSEPYDQVNQAMNLGYTWTWTNTASYVFHLGSNHNFSTMIGQEAKQNTMSLEVKGHNENSIFYDYEHAYLDNVPVVDPTLTTVNGRDDYGWSMSSYFGRVSYDFKETLLATVVLRTDASSKFPEWNRWATFPSASLGYIISNHDIMSSSSAFNYLKIRGSWGQNGNQDIEPYQYLSTLSYENANYYYGTDKSYQYIGAYPARVPNPDIKWETSEQTSIGFDAHFLRNKLQFNFDFYNKLTKDWLVKAPQLLTNGTEAAFINGGNVLNRGVELALRWTEQRGDFNYSASASFAYNKNEVTLINNDEKIIHGNRSVLSQASGEMNRVEEGFPIGYFWGYETNGVIQNETEAAEWLAPNGQPYFSDVRPGDFRFVNQNGDSLINDEDKVMIGDPNPDFIFGFQFNVDYKGIYMQLAANGAAGHQIAISYHSFDSPKQNYTTDIYNRWHGEGTSNDHPRLDGAAHRNTTNVSDFYIEDADFLRISNLTIGYDFNRLWSNSPIGQFKVYCTVKNLHTFTKYSGMDPEVSYGGESDWGSGIDLGMYPSSKTYMIGISAKF